KPYLRGYDVFHPQFEHLFNSYYQSIGEQYPRPQRGLLSRPTTEEIYRYRAHVDSAMRRLLEEMPPEASVEMFRRTVLGCHHEEQHQELLLTDIKYNLSVNPLKPAYRADLPAAPAGEPLPLIWADYAGGVREIGNAGAGFAFD